MSVGKKEEDQEQEECFIPPTAALVFTTSALASLPAPTSSHSPQSMNEACSSGYSGDVRTKTVCP